MPLKRSLVQVSLVNFSRYVDTPRMTQFQLGSSTEGENLSCGRSISYGKARYVNVTRERKLQAMCDLLALKHSAAIGFLLQRIRSGLLQSQMSLHTEYVATPAARSASHRLAPAGPGTLQLFAFR